MTIDRISQRVKLVIASIVASAVSLPISAHAVVVYNTNTGSPDGTISIYGDALIDQPQGQQGVAMSFVPTATVSLSQVQVLLAQAEGFPNATATVSFNIFLSDGSNAPDFGQLPLVTAFNLTASGALFNPVLESATFTNGPVLNAGTQYWLIGTASGNNAVDWWGTNGNSGFFGFVDGNPPFLGGFSPDSNQKAFVISGDLVSTSVPEPFTVIGTFIGGTAALRMRKKLRANKSENTID